MTKKGRVAFTLAVSLVALSLALPGLATEEDPDAEPGSETTIATNEGAGTEGEETGTESETVVTTDIKPAVEVTTPPLEAETADWTYRYLIPTGIALAVLVILATSGQYFTNVVRRRYRIIEE